MKRIAALAAVAATGAVLLAQAPASAINCPAGLYPQTYNVAGRAVVVCSPRIYCDPAACFPVAPGQ
jgi:hypothetical protein